MLDAIATLCNVSANMLSLNYAEYYTTMRNLPST